MKIKDLRKDLIFRQESQFQDFYDRLDCLYFVFSDYSYSHLIIFKIFFSKVSHRNPSTVFPAFQIFAILNPRTLDLLDGVHNEH